jgi:hypothetical protein
MGKLLLYGVPFVITLYAFIDCLLTPRDQVRSLPKFLWLTLVLVVPLVGAIAWFALGRPNATRYDDGMGGNGNGGGGSANPPGPRVPGMPSRRRSPSSPDDDPKFLRGLEEQAWAEKMRQRRSGDNDISPPEPKANQLPTD